LTRASRPPISGAPQPGDAKRQQDPVVNGDPLAMGTGAGSSVVEHVTFNHVVVGSIPTPLTNAR
jgi:hypothetical protein